MKKIIFWLVGVLLFAGLITGASLFYNHYMSENEPQNNVVLLGGTRPEKKTDAEETESTETHTDTVQESTESADLTDGTTTEGVEVDTETETSERGSATETETAPSRPMPEYDFTVYTADGQAVKLSDLRGKPIVMNFWATDCPYCVQEMPDFQAAYEKYGDEVTFMMICITSFRGRSVEHEQAYIDEKGYTFPVYYDTANQVAYGFGISSLPLTYFMYDDFTFYGYIPGMTNASLLEQCIQVILE